MNLTKRVGLLLAVLAAVVGSVMVGPASAVPSLQLGIGGGTYDPVTQTIISTSDTFTLFAYLVPDSGAPLGGTYYISAALIPQSGPTNSTLGSYSFNGTTIDVTTGMTYGTPPIESAQLHDAQDLAPHGIFETFFSEFAFTFNPANLTTEFNTQDNPGVVPVIDPAGTMYFAAFEVDVSALAEGYNIHFDLYNTDGTTDRTILSFAPFSHDAESRRQVPEASTMLVVGSGLLLAGLLARRRNRR